MCLVFRSHYQTIEELGQVKLARVFPEAKNKGKNKMDSMPLVLSEWEVQTREASGLKRMSCRKYSDTRGDRIYATGIHPVFMTRRKRIHV